ncbi:MAG: hypothetical protein AAF409_20125, partial [Pseudomonadota bacterium]
DDRAYGGVDNDTIEGGEGRDSLVGGIGADVVSGEDDDDIIFGNMGADMLYGGARSVTNSAKPMSEPEGTSGRPTKDRSLVPRLGR